MCQRIALGIEYEGTRYCGWQRQAQGYSVQGELEQALSKIAAQPITVQVAGRTDAGVHGFGQVVHFDTPIERPTQAWVLGTNRFLPYDIRVKWMKKVTPQFHARYGAYARRYQYLIYNHSLPPGILRNGISWFPYPLNSQRMNIAAKSLLGEHDFRSFQAAQCQSKTAKRRIYQLQVHQDGHLIVIDIIANAFLYHMVRNITGVLLAIGQQQQPLDWAKTVLLAQDRKQAGITAPASGLYLIDVKYPSHYGLPRPTVLPWFFRSEWQVEPYHIPEPSTNTLSI